MKSRDKDEVVRAKLLIVKANRMYAVCKGCNHEVPLPFSRDLGPDLYLDK